MCIPPSDEVLTASICRVGLTASKSTRRVVLSLFISVITISMVEIVDRNRIIEERERMLLGMTHHEKKVKLEAHLYQETSGAAEGLRRAFKWKADGVGVLINLQFNSPCNLRRDN